MCWFLLESITRYAAQKYEMNHRSYEQANWRYPRIFRDGKLILQQSSEWKYNAVHDSRKMWFEYQINALARVVDKERMLAFIKVRTDLLNRWFDQPHWNFDSEEMLFVEISDSCEYN